MPETLNFNINGQNPFLPTNTVEQNIALINQQVAQLNAVKDKLTGIKSPVEGGMKIWEEIDKEIASLTDEQKSILARDEDYIAYDTALQNLVKSYLIESVKDKVANSKEGKELLEKQLLHIKDKKRDIIKQSNKEMELFKRFQLAVQANPNLTYSEFINSIK